MQKGSCIVSVAFRQPYVHHSERQEQTIREMTPFVSYFAYRDCLPMKDRIEVNNIVTRFQESLYGFKPHAIQRMRDKGFTKVIWFDPSVLPTSRVTVLLDALDNHPVIVRTGDNPIVNMTNRKTLDWFGVSTDELRNVKHVGGTIYAFNFEDPKAVEVFELWKRAEENGIFGTQDEFMKGHWSDEACMALSLYKCNVPQYWCTDFSYLNQKEL